MLDRARRSGWLLCLAAVVGSALFAGCEVAKEKTGCAIAAGVVLVLAAAALVVRLAQ